MWWLDLLLEGLEGVLTFIYTSIIEVFNFAVTEMMGMSLGILQMDFVQGAINYAQLLAISILGVKVMAEAIQTYILRQNGDPDSDPAGLVIRTAQAVAVITTLPWITEQVFVFSAKLTNDISNLNKGTVEIESIANVVGGYISSGLVSTIMCLVIVIGLLVVCVQIGIRGAELALMSVIGSIMALNLTSNNRSLWSSWFKQLVIICVSQAIQLFMINGILIILLIEGYGSFTILLVFGWLWMTLKTPSYLKQFAYTTGFSGAMGGAAKQAGSMAMMRRMMAK